MLFALCCLLCVCCLLVCDGMGVWWLTLVVYALIVVVVGCILGVVFGLVGLIMPCGWWLFIFILLGSCIDTCA